MKKGLIITGALFATGVVLGVAAVQYFKKQENVDKVKCKLDGCKDKVKEKASGAVEKVFGVDMSELENLDFSDCDDAMLFNYGDDCKECPEDVEGCEDCDCGKHCEKEA